MRESVRFARQVGRTLIVVLAVGAMIAVASSAGGATGGPPSTLADSTTDELADATDGLNETTDELNETADEVDDELDDGGDELNETADELNETADELGDTTDELNESADELNESADDATDEPNETTEGIERTTAVEAAVDGTDGIRVSLGGVLEIAAATEGDLGVGLNGTLLETATRSTTALTGAAASDGDDGRTDSTADRSSGGAGGTDSAADGPTPRDAVDAGLVGVLGGLALLGKSAAAGGAGGMGTGGASAVSSVRGRLTRHLPRLVGTLSSIAGKLPVSLLRYSRYDDSDPLDHETRRDIYEAVETDPGRYLSALEERLDVSLSTIRHHLSVLEDEGLVETAKQNGKRRYYPDRTDDVELAAALDEPAKVRVLSVLADLGDAHNGRIADALDLDPSTVSHHLSSLEDDGLVERRRDGRTIVNSLAPAVESAYGSRTDSPRRPDVDGPERVRTRGDD